MGVVSSCSHSTFGTRVRQSVNSVFVAVPTGPPGKWSSALQWQSCTWSHELYVYVSTVPFFYTQLVVRRLGGPSDVSNGAMVVSVLVFNCFLRG